MSRYFMVYRFIISWSPGVTDAFCAANTVIASLCPVLNTKDSGVSFHLPTIHDQGGMANTIARHQLSVLL